VTTDPAEESPATFERRGAVGVITLNRPAARNAVNAALSAAVGAALEELEADPELAAGVVTGAGPAFCAGADLKALAAGERIGAPGHPEWGFAGLVEHRVDKPLVAAVNGLALGGGTEILLACDLAVLGEDALLGLPEVRYGLLAGAAGLIRLPRQFPVKLAMEHALTGRPISPEVALRHGLVNRVVPSAAVLPTALELAAEIAANAPLAVRATKRLVRAAAGAGAGSDRRLYRQQDEEIARLVASADAREGPRAFAEKRPPVWSGT
jgi:crotonobetainyl-CoA hydratase